MTQPATTTPSKHIVALSGGIGGAKLALGLDRILTDDRWADHGLTVIANTADDFEHMSLYVSPDIDTLVYTLAGLANTDLGWGRSGETWSFMQAMEKLGGDTWFNLGDGDLAMHVWRTSRLSRGDTLSTITKSICQSLSIRADILPMSDQPVRTRLRTDRGWLDFQPYFVGHKAEPTVHEIDYRGINDAKPAPGIIDALTSPNTTAIVICPSNPLISIEPILAIPGIRQAIKDAQAPVIAVSPIINGKAVKGPTTKMLRELGHEATAATVLQRYGDLLDAFIADPHDMKSLQSVASGVSLISADIIMMSLNDRERLARTVMDVALNSIA